MAKIIKGTLFPFLLAALFATGAQGQGSYTAASCNYGDVNAVINGPTHTAIDGDTINIPAGSCTWASSLSVTVGISIIGAGSSSTIINDAAAGATLVAINLSLASQTARVSGITFQPNSGSGDLGTYPLLSINGTCDSNSCPHVRVDHNTITGWTQSGNYDSFMGYVNDVFGVMDHNTMNFTGIFVNMAHSSYLGVGTYGDNSWAQPDSFGTDEAFYFESNTVTSSPANGAITDADNGGGPRFVVRFNNFTNCNVQTHGTESTGRVRSVRQLEVYSNTFNIPSGDQLWAIGLRGGTALSFNNSITGSGQFNAEVSLSLYRIGHSFTPWGFCGGQGAWDENDGTVYATGTITATSLSGQNLSVTDSTRSDLAQYYNLSNTYFVVDASITDSNGLHPAAEIDSSGSSNTVNSYTYSAWSSGEPAFNVGDTYQILRASACIDQPGRGQGTLLSGYSPSSTGWVNDALDPIYEWGSTSTAGSPSSGWIGPNWQNKTVENKDYYQQQASFNGTVGTGTGTLANRPSTCTPSVAYWATDQGNWNQSGSGGQGQLYVCTSTNTWTLYYTPYTYPHPLTAAGAGPLAPPTNIHAVAH
jgi:hypothetical protein